MENTEINNTPENENVNFESRLDLSKLQESIVAIKAELGSVIVG